MSESTAPSADCYVHDGEVTIAWGGLLWPSDTTADTPVALTDFSLYRGKYSFLRNVDTYTDPDGEVLCNGHHEVDRKFAQRVYKTRVEL